MPISYTLDRARRRIHTTVTGSVTVDDILQHFEAACREQILDYAELIDARDAAPPFLSAADIRRAAAAIGSRHVLPPCGPRAVMVSNGVVFAMTRMFAVLVSDLVPFEVFRDQTEAEKWLAGRCTPPTADS
ncbi:MAG TPA: hypothetical protein VL486_03005 [Verrucomicrobiae bacterium]|nr:hypothetical protein [Verrucomicrobiae bacterium]